ncbi:hypothetical protein FOA52_001142 [Chlamydomonas sp. UWO 241]|nr:hypothetical protein FOA52_001142 [Chlamydomonas sp. UWO 241]
MATGGGFRGVSAGQDARFSNKEKAQMAKIKFPKELSVKIDPKKVNWAVMREWIASRVTELLGGLEEEVLIGLIYNYLEADKLDAKQLHVTLTPFLEKNTSLFMKELWSMLASANATPSGIPQSLLDKEAAKLATQMEAQRSIQAQVEAARAAATAKMAHVALPPPPPVPPGGAEAGTHESGRASRWDRNDGSGRDARREEKERERERGVKEEGGERDRSREKDKDKERDRSREGGRRGREEDRSREREDRRTTERSRDRDKDRSRERDDRRTKDRSRDRDDRRTKELSRDRRDRSRDKHERSRDRRNKSKDRDGGRVERLRRRSRSRSGEPAASPVRRSRRDSRSRSPVERKKKRRSEKKHKRERRSRSRSRSEEPPRRSAGPLSSAVTSGVLSGMGDLLAQALMRYLDERDGKSPADYDALRTLTMFGFGFCWYGPFQYYWYNVLEWLMPLKNTTNFFCKVISNQLLLAPCTLTAVFAWTLTMRGQLEAVPDKLSADLWPTMVNGWKFWVPAASVNFYFVPVQAQVLYMSCCGVLWTAYLSYASMSPQRAPQGPLLLSGVKQGKARK